MSGRKIKFITRRLTVILHYIQALQKNVKIAQDLAAKEVDARD